MIGQAFLGLTIACARCHDHMSDPISTDEYYKLGDLKEYVRWKMLQGQQDGLSILFL